MSKKRIAKEKFCIDCKSKDNLQVSINLLTDPTYLCSKCIADYCNRNKEKSIKDDSK